MKKLLMILGGVCLFGLAVFAAVALTASSGAAQYTRETESYVNTTLPLALAGLDADKLVRFWAPEDRAQVKPEGVARLMDVVRERFGTFESAAPAELIGYKVDYSLKGRTITAKLTADCRFSKRATTATLFLKKAQADWGLTGITFSLDAKSPT